MLGDHLRGHGPALLLLLKTWCVTASPQNNRALSHPFLWRSCRPPFSSPCYSPHTPLCPPCPPTPRPTFDSLLSDLGTLRAAVQGPAHRITIASPFPASSRTYHAHQDSGGRAQGDSFGTADFGLAHM